MKFHCEKNLLFGFSLQGLYDLQAEELSSCPFSQPQPSYNDNSKVSTVHLHVPEASSVYNANIAPSTTKNSSETTQPRLFGITEREPSSTRRGSEATTTKQKLRRFVLKDIVNV